MIFNYGKTEAKRTLLSNAKQLVILICGQVAGAIQGPAFACKNQICGPHCL
jgi:hypothetical protein